MKRHTLSLAVLAASQMGVTQCGEVTTDPGFDLWCGDKLCDWKIERGNVARVPTWNSEGDPGVELVGDDVAIEQLTPVDNIDGTCMEFHLIANVALDAQVNLDVDVDGDGSLEQVEQIPTSSWQPLTFLIAIQPPFAGVRFELAKKGSGDAVLAQIQVKISDACGSIPPLDARPFPLGAPCTIDGDCASGTCADSTLPIPFAGGTHICTDCTGDSCGSAEVCGAAPAVGPVRGVPEACVAPASKLLGDMCVSDAECTSSICTFGACSTCRDGGSGCSGGEVCGPSWPTAFGVFSPWTCSPGGKKRVSGEPCATDDDCANESCGGAIAKQCADGRACGNDVDCPFISAPDGDGLINGPCSVVGVEGGACN